MLGLPSAPSRTAPPPDRSWHRLFAVVLL